MNNIIDIKTAQFWLYEDFMNMPPSERQLLYHTADVIATYTLNRKLHVVDGLRRYFDNPDVIISSIADDAPDVDIPLNVSGTIIMLMYMMLNWGYTYYTTYETITVKLQELGVWDWCATHYALIGPYNISWMLQLLTHWQQVMGYVQSE